MANFEEAFKKVCELFKLNDLNSYQKEGVSSVNLSDVKEGDLKDVEEGKYSVAYGTSEAWLKHER
ncbi:Hypothetical predicted protein, partial [Paramuricea clavata]